MYKSHLQIVESEILHHHLKLFKKDVLETLYYLNLYNNKTQEDEVFKVFENMNDCKNHFLKPFNKKG